MHVCERGWKRGEGWVTYIVVHALEDDAVAAAIHSLPVSLPEPRNQLLHHRRLITLDKLGNTAVMTTVNTMA